MKNLAQMVLSGEMISDDGMLLLGFQRTKQISGKSRRKWMKGDDSFLSQEIRERRAEIFNGALDEIFQEYVPIREYLIANKIRPKSVIDIGCGQAINDAFLESDFSPRFTLVDIEETDDQYHGWANTGSGYASLHDASVFLKHNGVSAERLMIINPRKDPAAVFKINGDFVCSLYSCGFHYPIDEYLDLFCRTVIDGGVVVLDFRKGYLNKNTRACTTLFSLGQVVELYDDEKSKRLLVTAKGPISN